MAIRGTRQGIALGAVAALGLTMIATAPASANSNRALRITPVENEVRNGLLQNDFAVNLHWARGTETDTFGDLKWQIVSAKSDAGEDMPVYWYGEDWEWDFSEDDADIEGFEGGCDVPTPSEPLTQDAPWAGQVDEDGYTFDATKAPLNEDSNWGRPDLQFGVCYDDPELLEVDIPELDDLKWVDVTVRAFVDEDAEDNVGHDVLNKDELFAPDLTVRLWNVDNIPAPTVSTKNVNGRFDLELANVTVTAPWKLNSWPDTADEVGEAYDDRFEANADSLELVIQQTASDGNDITEFDYFEVTSTDWDMKRDGDGTVYLDTTETGVGPLGITNEGSKSNNVFLAGVDFDMGDPTKVTRVSNISKFGYVSSAKIDRKNGTAKMYAYDILGAGLVEFRHNGRVIARIDMVDQFDVRTLTLDGNRPYFVRTVNLVRGKNVLEVRVNGTVLKRHTYTLRAGMV